MNIAITIIKLTVRINLILLISSTPVFAIQNGIGLMNKDVFSDLYGSYRHLVLLVTGDNSCVKCYFEAGNVQNEIHERGFNIHVINVIVVNRLTDSNAYAGRTYISSPRFVTRESLRGWDSRKNESAWYYYCADSSMLHYGSLLKQGGADALYLILSKPGERTLAKVRLSQLDEAGNEIIKPVFNAFIRDSTIVVGSTYGLQLAAHNVHSGKVSWRMTFSDSAFVGILSNIESLASNHPVLQPAILAADCHDDKLVTFVGRIIAMEYDSTNRKIRYGRKYFIAQADMERNTLVWVKSPSSLHPRLSDISFINSQIRYPLLYTTRCPWSIKGDNIYNAPLISITNLHNSSYTQGVVVDSAYRILRIEDNMANGLFCIIDGDLWTSQPHGSTIRNERTGDLIQLEGEYYRDYYLKLEQMAAAAAADNSLNAFQRYEVYALNSVLTGIYSIGDSCIAVMTYENDSLGATHEWLSVYDLSSKRLKARQRVNSGWTMQFGSDRVMRIELEDGKYVITSYTIE
jgi:hypothetical protein